MDVNKSNIGELGYDFLKSKLDYNNDLSSYTQKLIEDELRLRQIEMEKYLLSGLHNLPVDALMSLNSRVNRYPTDFENKIKSTIINKNENHILKSNERIRKGNTRWVATLIILVFIGLCAVLTNPDSNKHKEVIKTKLYSLMQSSIKENAKENNSQWESVGQAFGMFLGKPIIDNMVENLVSSDNYVLFSTTKITWEGKTRIIGIGAFGNVFLSSELDEALNEGILKKEQQKSENK